MIKKLVAGMLALALLFVVGLAQAEAYQNYADPNADRDISVRGKNADGNFDLNPVIPGESATTGLPFDGEYHPVLVSIDNNPNARAQWGIRFADVIYEVPIQGNTATRLVGLFSDVHPEEAGPVRSIRILHVDLRESWDSALVFWGMQTDEGSSVAKTFTNYGVRRYSGQIIVFDGADGGGKPWLKSYTDTSIHSAPHDKSANIRELASLAASSGYVFKERPFLFTDDLPSGGETAARINIDYNGEEHYSSSFFYNEDENAYVRYSAGTPFIDLEAPDAPLMFQNLIIQRTKLTFYNGSSKRPLLTEVGRGNADIFIGGRYIAGYWVRTGLEERTVYFDDQGNELALQRGKTYIMITTALTNVTYE